ncbi:hypothetical protein [Rugamonas apoptosis]|uniref:Uncharacterized protein n=1 Tax=Rugamonas apoptosis TaxID=2758570 RepID=A0A7W2F7W0_9BURK|nr:hypothetical protein [Rugamonas apoptosis]MBA5686706.1 hypothetical protein [Rugamonas apoptosis]
MSAVTFITGAWDYLTRALAAVEPPKVAAAQLWHRAYGYQPIEGISTATIIHASLYGSTLQLNVVFPLLPSKPWGVFELPASAVQHFAQKRRFKFSAPAELYGARVELHTGPQFQHDGYPRSRVIGVKVLSTAPPDTTH